MGFAQLKKEIGGQILAMPQHSTVYKFAKALGATHAEAMQTVADHNKLDPDEQVLAQQRMTRFLDKRGGSREAIKRIVAAGGHAFYDPGAELGCGGCGKAVAACSCAGGAA